MFKAKKKQKEVLEAMQKDTAAIKEYLVQLRNTHAQAFSEEEKQALEAIDTFLDNLNVWFSGFKQGLRG